VATTDPATSEPALTAHLPTSRAAENATLPAAPVRALAGPQAPWRTVADGRGESRPGDRGDRPLRMRRVFAQVTASAVAVLVVVAVAGAYASKRVAEREAVHAAAQTADLLAESAVEPALTDALLTSPAAPPAALATVDQAVRSRVLSADVVHVKLWTPSGRVVYSDEAQIIGATFALGDEERSVLTNPTTHAEVSDLSRPENVLERRQGPLLEVYRPVWTPSGQPLLFETYLSYDLVTARAGQLWRGFAGITVTSLLLMIALMLPILWRLLDRVRAGQAQRVALLERAVSASTDERARIAGTLHDGVVQELAAASFSVAGAAQHTRVAGRADLAGELDQAAAAVRGAIGGLRTLLVDIYPPSLRSAGLVAALTDLAVGLRTRDLEVDLDLPADGLTRLDEDGERLVFRVAQECLRNVAKHAAPRRVSLGLVVSAATVTLTLADDGTGFDAAAVLADPPPGHLGLPVIADLVARAGGLLEVSTAPGAGTAWRLVLDRSDRRVSA
jgi:two-component system, NarL family, sensor kinase